MNFNQNMGYGKVSMSVPFQPIGKIFAVGDSSTVNIDILKQIMIPDPAGTIRFCATLDAAMDLATADAGDVIYLMPGHTETVSATGVALIDKAGVSVIGLGKGTLNPLFNITTTSGKIQITARDTTLQNVTVQAGSGSSGCARGIELLSTTACKNILLDSITFQKSSLGAAFETIISITSGTDSTGSNFFDGLKIKNNVFNYYTSSVTGVGIGVNLVFTQLDFLEFSGNKGSVYSSGGIFQSSGIGYGWQMNDNKLHNQSTGLTLDLNGTATYGQMNNNFLTTLSTGAKGAVIDTGAIIPIETYVGPSQNADKVGALPLAAIT